MAVYEYICTKCGVESERFLSMANRKQPEEQPCPECGGVVRQAILNAPPLGDPVKLGVTKLPGGFNDVIKGIKNANRNSTIELRGN